MTADGSLTTKNKQRFWLRVLAPRFFRREFPKSCHPPTTLGSYPSLRTFAQADHSNHDWFRCIARRHQCIECWTPWIPSVLSTGTSAWSARLLFFIDRSSSGRDSSTSLELKMKFRISKPPAPWTVMTSLINWIDPATDSQLSRYSSI